MIGETCLHGVAVYNPALWSREELKRYFVARTELLERVIDDLRRERSGSPCQHRLVLGLRGMGKSTLLRRIGIAVEEDEALGKEWLPLTFPEEQYNISSPADLWLNCLDAFCDILEERGLRDQVTALDRAVEELDDTETILERLLSEADKLGCRLLLLIDNIDLILERLKKEHWSLREILQSEPRLLIIGASSQAIEASYQYDAAFYDFFRVDELKGLTEAEMRATLTRLAEQGKTPHVLDLLKDDPARIKTLHTLTGGNPRTIVLLYNVLARGLDGDVRSDLEGLLDMVTPLYKARFEELPAQAQQLVDGLAVNWDPMTARQLADKLGWDVNTTSSQLNRLQQQALVEKVEPAKGKRAAFQIGERFFNIWYLMRASRRVRRRLIWLVHFLRMFFSADELQGHARKLLGEQGLDVRRAEYKLALARAMENKCLCRALEHNALSCIVLEKKDRKKIEALLDLEGDDAELRPQLNRILRDIKDEKLRRHTELIYQAISEGIMTSMDDVDRAEHAAQKYDAPGLAAATWNNWCVTYCCKNISEKQKERIATAYKQAIQADPNNDRLYHDLGRILEKYKYAKEAEKCYRKAIELKPNGTHLWLSLAELLHFTSGRFSEAEDAYRKFLEADKNNSLVWNNFGVLLHNHLEKFEEAEQAYRQAIEIDQNNASTWKNLGNLLRRYFKRLPEAEYAYNEAIRIDNNDASSWFNIGIILQDQERLHESEQAYRKSLEIEPNNWEAWTNVGVILSENVQRFQEAEQAYRKAIEIEPNEVYPWLNIGKLLEYKLKNFNKAEEAYKKAIEIEPRSSYSWNALGNLLQIRLNRCSEAEHAYRKAIETDPNSSDSWNGLGSLLQKYCKRFSVAEQAFMRAIELEPKNAVAYSNVAWLYYKQKKKLDQAVKFAKKSYELSSGDKMWESYTLSTLLVANNEWKEAENHIRYLIDKGDEEFFNAGWTVLFCIFKEAVYTGRTADALKLIDQTPVAERWRPLREALAAAAEGSRRYLNGVAPEVRQPALSILKEIAPELLEEK
ncbi:MAG: tetratricopeptide repeat protein [Candidatus Electrothrix sp. Rat3]|nr:tetratricopeptide repeat protein [Candidatus Electrothrix rattekaaiensis]